jgi:outer membrane lipoprotein LolB
MISRKFLVIRSWLAGALVVSLAACSSPPMRPLVEGGPAQATREAQLLLRPDWSFSGRVAVSNGGNAGNARIEWTQRGEDFDIRLTAPITGQSWKLHRAGGEVSLEGLEGGLRQGQDAEALLEQATGWRIPVAAMAAWVRGRRSGSEARLEFSPDGLPANLTEAGWSVEYRAWNREALPLPTKLFARKDHASVRLVVDRWGEP